MAAHPVRYRLTTIVPGVRSANGDEASGFLPAFSVRNGDLALEHGLHQEIGWERNTDASGVAVLFYADRVDNPVLEAMARLASGGDAGIASNALIDRAGDIIRAAGPGFSTAGFMATAEHRLPGDNHIRLSFANGNALVMPASRRPMPFNALLASARPRRAPMYSISLSGTLEGTGTRWHASYRWQPEDTVTRVATFAADAAEPFFNLRLRQPVTYHHEGPSSLDVMLDVHNLLAQGFRPYVLTDGSLLMFAQDQRSFAAASPLLSESIPASLLSGRAPRPHCLTVSADTFRINRSAAPLWKSSRGYAILFKVSGRKFLPLSAVHRRSRRTVFIELDA